MSLQVISLILNVISIVFIWKFIICKVILSIVVVSWYKGRSKVLRVTGVPDTKQIYSHCFCSLKKKKRTSEYTVLLYLSNCNNFYFTFEFKVQMWVQIYQIFERDQIPICHLSNKSNPNTDKPKGFQIWPNINEY